MATGESQFTIKKYPGMAGKFVDSDHIAHAYDSGQPHDLGGAITQIFSAQNRFKSRPLMGMTQGSGNIKYVKDERFRWKLRGSTVRTMTVLENLESSNTAPGVGNQTFKVKLDQDWCAEPEVMMSEDADYPLVVQGRPIPDGDGYIYTFKLQSNDPNAFVPPSLLEEGKRFRKVWTVTASESNYQRGGQQYGGHFMLESQIGFFGQEITITDKAQRKGGYSLSQGTLGIPMVVEIDGKEKIVEKFMPTAEYMMHDELMASMEAAMLYGKRYQELDKNGYVKFAAPGLREYAKDGHIEYFDSTEPNIDDFFDWLMDIFFARVDEEDRKISIMTGTMGSLMLHEMIVTKLGDNAFADSQHYIRKYGNNPMHLSYGAQFKHYFGGEGIEFDVIKNPYYDSLEYQGKTHPLYPSRPTDSWRLTVLDFTENMTDSGEMESNIQMLKNEDYYAYGYTLGAIGPAGPVKGQGVASSKREYTSFVDDSAAIWVKDATKIGEWIFDYED